MFHNYAGTRLSLMICSWHVLQRKSQRNPDVTGVRHEATHAALQESDKDLKWLDLIGKRVPSAE